MYLDPGFGSMVIQMAIAGAAALGAWLFMFRQKIKKLLGIAVKEEPAAEAEPPAVTPEKNERQE
jgi:hypothetical protein